jgi:hypothetical protein
MADTRRYGKRGPGPPEQTPPQNLYQLAHEAADDALRRTVSDAVSDAVSEAVVKAVSEVVYKSLAGTAPQTESETASRTGYEVAPQAEPAVTPQATSAGDGLLVRAVKRWPRFVVLFLVLMLIFCGFCGYKLARPHLHPSEFVRGVFAGIFASVVTYCVIVVKRARRRRRRLSNGAGRTGQRSPSQSRAPSLTPRRRPRLLSPTPRFGPRPLR